MGVVQNIMQHWSLTSSRLWSLNKDMSLSSCLVCSLSWRLWADISFWACSRSSTVKAFTPSWLNTHTHNHSFWFIIVWKATAHNVFVKTSNDSHLVQFGLKETFNPVLVRLTDWVKLLHLPWQVPVFLLQTEELNKMLFWGYTKTGRFADVCHHWLPSPVLRAAAGWSDTEESSCVP